MHQLRGGIASQTICKPAPEPSDAMNRVTVIWSMGAGACLTLAAIHIVVWWKDRTARASLVFAVMATAVAAFAALELAMMRAETPEQWGNAVRWVHVPVWVIIASLVVFVRLYLRAGRGWLAWAVVGVRTLSLILDFVFSPNINYREVTAIRHISFLGDSVSVATGVSNPWMLVAQVSLLLLVIFVVDATITVWRRGNRRQALMVGGSILLFTIAGTVEGITITWGIIPMPLTASLFYQGLVWVMAWKLSYDVLHASTLARQLQASEAGLRESEERFRIVANAAPVLIWMSGVDKLCTFFNKPWLEFSGRSLEQEMGNGWAEGVHPDDLQRCLKIYNEAFDARQPFVMQYRLRRNDGQYRWLSDQGVARHDAQGNFAGYIGSCVDVTELINKERALREFEDRVVLAAEAAHLGVWEMDTATNEIWMSDSGRSLFQFDSETRLDHAAVQGRVHPEDRALRDSAVRRAIETRGGYEIEYRVLLPDGTSRWIGARGRCVTGEKGAGARLIGVSIDITAQKEAQDVFRMAAEGSHLGVWHWDEVAKALIWDRATRDTFGVSADLEITLDTFYRALHPDDIQRVKQTWRRALELRLPYQVEFRTLRPDGTIRWVDARGRGYYDEAGKPLGMTGVIFDITDRKEAELAAQRNREELSHLSRVASMGELAASIAHELNQPLSGITSNASAGQRFIDRGDVDLRELRDLLGDIVADGQRAGDVIRGIQRMVKKSVGAHRRIDLNDIVMSVARMVKANAMLHSCELGTFLDPDLPTVEGDPIQLQQVLLNLVINAFDAMREAPISHRKVIIATEGNADGATRVSVRDYGLGIPEEARERVFEHFFTTKREGLGMGLAIVRSIIESHGGTIAAENADGGGARFQFTLPASVAPSAV
jgi:PAS domain S-box-containing protein